MIINNVNKCDRAMPHYFITILLLQESYLYTEGMEIVQITLVSTFFSNRIEAQSVVLQT